MNPTKAMNPMAFQDSTVASKEDMDFDDIFE